MNNNYECWYISKHWCRIVGDRRSMGCCRNIIGDSILRSAQNDEHLAGSTEHRDSLVDRAWNSILVVSPHGAHYLL